MPETRKISLQEYQKNVAALLAPVRHPQLANVIALVEEVGEVCREIMNEQIYKNSSPIELRRKLEPEMADVLLSLMELASNYGVDLQDALDHKLETIRAKIPQWAEHLGPALEAKRKQLDTRGLR